MNQENKELISKAPSGRVKRSPVGTRNRLTVRGKEPGFVYRVVNDDEDRVTQLSERGYELVSDSAVKVGDNRVSKTSSEGTVKQLSVGAGKKAYVMRIRQDWYDEDQKAKNVEVDSIEATIKKKATADGRYGKLSIGKLEE